MDKRTSISEVFTQAQIDKAAKCRSTQEIHDKVTKPLIKQINERTKQENDPMYWAYVLQYVLNSAGKR